MGVAQIMLDDLNLSKSEKGELVPKAENWVDLNNFPRPYNRTYEML
nr:unnamed protein product [Callosobruchus chinensis]